MNKDIKVPVELSDPFFSVVMEDWKYTESVGELMRCPFVYEALYYAGSKRNFPWESPELFLPALFDEWNRVCSQLTAAHQRKRLDEDYLKMMKTGIAYFLEALFWTNHLPCRLPIGEIADLSVKPANVEDRLGSVMNRPRLYHSVVQLGELMDEQRKHFASFTVKKRNEKNDPKGR